MSLGVSCNHNPCGRIFCFNDAKNMLDKTEVIQTDIGRLNDDICFIDENGDTYYGSKSLSYYYLNSKNDILWNNIAALFPSLDEIHIQCIKKIHGVLNGFKLLPSIAVDDVFIDGIFS